ncbi:hypothetical protein Bca4012_064709 [Brassica carinata]
MYAVWVTSKEAIHEEDRRVVALGERYIGFLTRKRSGINSYQFSFRLQSPLLTRCCKSSSIIIRVESIKETSSSVFKQSRWQFFLKMK